VNSILVRTYLSRNNPGSVGANAIKKIFKKTQVPKTKKP
jgi:hypothetical protein